MSLYNMIHGVNETTPILLMIAGIDPEVFLKNRDSFRFRDCYANEDGTEVVVYTRIGGSNRERWSRAVQLLRDSPTYVRDEDDEFDNTFASFYFRPVNALCEEMLRVLHVEGRDGSERPARARKLLEDLEAGRETPDTLAAAEAAKPMVEGLNSLLSGNSSTVSVETKEGYGVEMFVVGETPVREQQPRSAPDEDA